MYFESYKPWVFFGIACLVAVLFCIYWISKLKTDLQKTGVPIAVLVCIAIPFIATTIYLQNFDSMNPLLNIMRCLTFFTGSIMFGGVSIKFIQWYKMESLQISKARYWMSIILTAFLSIAFFALFVDVLVFLLR